MAALSPILFSSALVGHYFQSHQSIHYERFQEQMYTPYNDFAPAFLQPPPQRPSFDRRDFMLPFTVTQETGNAIFSLWEQFNPHNIANEDETIAIEVANKVLSDSVSNLDSSASPDASSCAPASDEELQLLRTEIESHKKRGYNQLKSWIYSSITNGIFRHLNGLRSIPLSIQASLAAVMAELAKKDNKLRASRIWARSSLLLFPHDWRAWTLSSKLEEELGNTNLARQILSLGIRHCCQSARLQEAEGLALRLLRLSPRGTLDGTQDTDATQLARRTIGTVMNTYLQGKDAGKSQQPSLSSSLWWNSPPDSEDSDDHGRDSDSTRIPYRLLLEGAMLEYRAGRRDLAKGILEFLVAQVPRVQPYCTLLDLLEKERRWSEMHGVLRLGLSRLPNASVLYFEALKLYGKPSQQAVSELHSIEEAAQQNLSPELIWKFFLEAAQARAQSGADWTLVRRALTSAARHAPASLRWKVFNSGSKLELLRGNIAHARKSAVFAVRLAPKKICSAALLDYARLEECVGNSSQALYILSKSMNQFPQEWRLDLEAVLVAMRAQKFDQARVFALNSLRRHGNTGRLYAITIQLERILKFPLRHLSSAVEKALAAVPKSGELWCETARLFISMREYAKAKRALEFSLTFTPQYFDSLLEMLRLHLLTTSPSSRKAAFDLFLERVQHANYEPNYGQCYLFCRARATDSSACSLLSVGYATMEQLMSATSAFRETLDIAGHVLSLDFSKLALTEKVKLVFD